VNSDSDRANAPYRMALGMRISETHPLTVAGNIIMPRFFSARPAYVASPRGDPNVLGRPTPLTPIGSAVAAGYWEGLREMAVGQSLPGYLRHYKGERQ